MNKLNYRFFYYKTRASYEKDSMYDRIPEDAIIFIEDEGSIAIVIADDNTTGKVITIYLENSQITKISSRLDDTTLKLNNHE